MQTSYKKIFLFLLFFSIFVNPQAQPIDNKIVIVIIDGSRYSETLGDPTHTYTPKMWELSKQGTIIDNFENNRFTYTRRGLSALTCGAWTEVHDIDYHGYTRISTNLPTIFEYYRKDKNASADDCFYIATNRYFSLPSFDANYGITFWPTYRLAVGYDKETATEAQRVMDEYHPHLIWVYLLDVDEEGHDGNWTKYTKAITTADSIVNVLWEKIQSDPFYRNTTTLMVSNDHGRHDDGFGGFQGHGCFCNGCRHILFLALGPTIKQNYISSRYRTTPDLAVTASYILGINPTKATGSVMYEIMTSTGVNDNNYQFFTLNGSWPNPFSTSTRIQYFVNKPGVVHLEIYSITGEKIKTIVNDRQDYGLQDAEWNATNNQNQRITPGIYFYRLQLDKQKVNGKLVFVNN